MGTHLVGVAADELKDVLQSVCFDIVSVLEGTHFFHVRSELQSATRRFDVRIGGGDAADHRHFGIAAERGFQQPCQF